jgi:GNAT superfamily N-acetyltransferase
MTHPMSDHIPLMRIRPAEVHEAEALASIAWAAKASWGYSRAQLEAWREGFTPTCESIRLQPTYVAEFDDGLAGFCQLNLSTEPVELEHLWVHPRFMRRGVGRALLARCTEQSASLGFTSTLIRMLRPSMSLVEQCASAIVRLRLKASPIGCVRSCSYQPRRRSSASPVHQALARRCTDVREAVGRFHA